MKTKHDEILKTTSDISEMKGLYLAQRLLRSWKEDFVDEDTGNVTTIERNELVLEKGVLLDEHKLTEVSFLLQSGDIKEVTVSDQKRECILHQRYSSLWVVGLDLSGKGKNIYLYANSINTALEIASDYAEQAYKGYYSIKSAKEIGYGNLLPELDNEEDEEEDVYSVEIQITENDEANKSTFILKASDAENAKQKIGDYIAAIRIKEEKNVDFELKIISAKTIPCNFIVEPEFSRKYIEINREVVDAQALEISKKEEE